MRTQPVGGSRRLTLLWALLAALSTAGVFAFAQPDEAPATEEAIPFFCSGYVYAPWKSGHFEATARVRVRSCFRVSSSTAYVTLHRYTEIVGNDVFSGAPHFDSTFRGDCWSGVYRNNAYHAVAHVRITSVRGTTTAKTVTGPTSLLDCDPIMGPAEAVRVTGKRLGKPTMYETVDEGGASVEDFTVEGVDPG